MPGGSWRAQRACPLGPSELGSLGCVIAGTTVIDLVQFILQ